MASVHSISDFALIFRENSTLAGQGQTKGEISGTPTEMSFLSSNPRKIADAEAILGPRGNGGWLITFVH